MYRGKVNRKSSRKQFNKRAGKTNKVNTMAPLRGGIRL